MNKTMTTKGFFLRILLLTAAFIAVAAVMIVTMQKSFGFGPDESQGSQRFFRQFIIAGGPIVWFVLIPMSLVTVYLAFDYWLTIKRQKLLPADIGQNCLTAIRQYGLDEFPKKLGNSRDLVSIAIVKMASDIRGDWNHKKEILADSVQQQAAGLFRRIEWLNLIGNVSPMVGLFGTVYGMIKLFNAIVAGGGQPQLVRLADGISVALVTTFWGLFIAIPALAVHGIFRNRIEGLLSDAVTELESIVPELRRRVEVRPTPLYRKPPETGIRELLHKPKPAADQSLPL